MPSNKEVFSFAWFMTRRGKEILNMHFFRDNEATIILKSSNYKAMYGGFFEIEALLSLKNAWSRLIFFSDNKSTTS